MIREVVIRPSAPATMVNLRELWQHRDLLWMLVWRDFALRYRQTVLGPIWFLLQPLLPTVVFTVVFGMIARMPTDGLPGFLFFFCNQIIWGYFAGCYSSTSTVLINNIHLFSKVYFPRLIVPLSSVIGHAVSLLIQLTVFLIIWWWVGTPTATTTVSPWVRFALLPPLVLLAAIQGLGFGLWMTVLTAKYRDLQQIAPLILQMWMYGSAVVFPLSQVPAKYQPLMLMNPVTFVVESFRFSLLGVGSPSLNSAGLSSLISVVVLLTGLMAYNRTIRTYVDFG